MKPINIHGEEEYAELRKKVQLLMDDIYNRLIQVNDRVFDFNTGRLRNTTASFATETDQVVAGGVVDNITDITNRSHDDLQNLSADDHTQYALLAGRSSGQTLIGGTASGEDLTLQSTANATKGSILFGGSEYDEVNDRLGVNQTSPTALIHANQDGSAAAIPVVHLEQDDVSEEFIRFTGQAAAATLTQSLVAEADVSTATRVGFVKVNVQDEGNQITDGAYYVAIYSLA